LHNLFRRQRKQEFQVSTPRLYQALQFSKPNAQGRIDHCSIHLAANDREEAIRILREEGFVSDNVEVYLLADWAIDKGPRTRIGQSSLNGAHTSEPTTIEQHANWVRVMTRSHRDDGEVTPPTWVRAR
jgi:hypothetical protein